MEKKTKKQLKSVKIGLTQFNMCKDHKSSTGVPISIFIERAIEEKLSREKSVSGT